MEHGLGEEPDGERRGCLDQCFPRREGMALHIQGRTLGGSPKALPQGAGASCSQP